MSGPEERRAREPVSRPEALPLGEPVDPRWPAEDASRQTNLRRVLEGSLAGIALVRGTRVIFRNPAFEALFGPVTDITHMVEAEQLSPDEARKLQAFLARIQAPDFERGELGFHFYAPNEQGLRRSRWVHCRAWLSEYAGQQVVLLNLLDLTEARELKQVLAVHDRMTSLGRLASGMAHDIRNALSSINLYLPSLARLLESAELDPQAQRILEQLQAASNRIEAVVDRIRDFSRPGEPVLEPTDPARLVAEALDLCAAALERSQVAVQTRVEGEIGPCLLDPIQLARVLGNLIQNAVEAMQDSRCSERRLTLTTRMAGGKLQLRVADTGPGVPGHLREAIFDPFFTTKKEGTGIGLSICQRILLDHGGILRLGQSRAGGAEFVIEVPARRG